MSIEVFTHRKLPHWYRPGAVHFVTYRLAGTIPDEVWHSLQRERERLFRRQAQPGVTKNGLRERMHKMLFEKYDRHLDTNRDVAWLAEPEVAAMLRRNLYHHNGSKYYLIAYCVMPNHVHVVFQPVDKVSTRTTPEWLGKELPDSRSPLSRILHSLKSYTAKQANGIRGTSGQFWQAESYDHWVRDEEEFGRVVEYVAWNPVRAGLVEQPHEWFFCSAHDRFLADGTRLGALCYPR